ncbi:MAG: hypothetical protein Q4A17_01650 [Thermoguttaceae bacterium]|nr:hypothetical protein [Thermoguttaceae bacterium]
MGSTEYLASNSCATPEGTWLTNSDSFSHADRSWAKERLFKHHGISPQKFPLYLKELEFRYDHPEESIFEQLVEFLSDFVPELPKEPHGSASQREFQYRVLIFMKIVLVQILDNYPIFEPSKCKQK